MKKATRRMRKEVWVRWKKRRRKYEIIKSPINIPLRRLFRRKEKSDKRKAKRRAKKIAIREKR